MIQERVEEYYELVKEIEWQLIGSSILIVYEGDSTALQSALDNPAPDFDEDASDSEEEDDEEEQEKPKLACAVKVIDFAHARARPGQGVDAGYNLGLETCLKLLTQRMVDLAR